MVSRPEGLPALERLATREREGRVGEDGHGLRRPPPRARRTRGRRGSRRPRFAAPSPCAAQAVGRPRRRSAPSSRSSWTSVAMCTSSTAAPPRRRARRRARSAACEEDEHRRSRLPPAASVSVPIAPTSPGCEPTDCSSAPRAAPGSLEPGAERTVASAFMRARRSVERDDPAAEQPPAYLAEARARASPSPSSRGREAAHARREVRVGRAAGKRLSEHRHDPIEPEAEEGRSTPLGCVISRQPSRPPGRSTRAQLAQPALRGPRRCGSPKPTVAASKDRVVERQREQVALHPLDRRPTSAAPARASARRSRAR